MTPEEIRKANATARASGAVGARALVPAYVLETAQPGESVLDFGAGRPVAGESVPMHTARYRAAGLDAKAFDIGANAQWADPDCLSRAYDTVAASNVLNVQPSSRAVLETLDAIAELVKPGGRAVVNYPASPRYSDVSNEELRVMLSLVFADVKRVGPMVFECRLPWCLSGREVVKYNGAG